MHADGPGKEQGRWACHAAGRGVSVVLVVVVVVVVQYLVISASGSRPKW